MDEKEKLELARVVLDQGEKKLAAQMQLALAADQKALIVAGFVFTLATGVIGYGASDSVETFGRVWGFSTGTMLLAAAAACLSAAWTRDITTVGNAPNNWWSDNVDKRPLSKSLRNMSMHYDLGVKSNHQMLKLNAGLFRGGVVLALLAPFLGGLFAWIAPSP